MAEGNETKAEGRDAGAAGAAATTKAERKQARAGRGTKAERRQARGGRKGRKGAAPAAVAEGGSAEDRLELRLARIEEAVAAQSELSEELLEKINEVIQAPESSHPGEGVDD